MRLIDSTPGDWDSIRQGFRWQVPQFFNIAEAVCDRHARDRDRVALYYENDEGEREEYTFRQIQRKANQFANVLRGLGIGQGDRTW